MLESPVSAMALIDDRIATLNILFGGLVALPGGNFTLNGKTTNLAQYDTNSHTWYTRFEPQLYLYGEAAGEVNDLVVRPSTLYDSLYVVGSFDTVCKTCQQLYCSVGFWTGEEFDKVGDGLCPRATDVTMKILTAALTPGGGAFFVGGTFQSRVWSGEKFVNIYNVAQHDPTNGNSSGGGGLGCNWCTVSVLSLAWNDQAKILYIGGKFNMVDSAYIAPGLAFNLICTLLYSNDTVYDGVATSLVYDEESRSLFVAGTFQLVNGRPCSSIAVWREELRSWRCLYEEQHSFSLITSLLYTKKMLYVAGMPANASSWSTTSTTAINPNPNRQNGPATYMIARMSQSPALFSGKYDQWTGGDLSDNTSDHTSKGGRQLQSRDQERNEFGCGDAMCVAANADDKGSSRDRQ
ncbi:hypothetical protein JKP88DRAFT_262058 [Tribonema minus]|uniref:Uncharacterized protein n=1 Tax=Tribonema minus TaxID=303371 RepID=A0A836CLE2_9STRA|nr:hypothetical protein JKP88DRAFT_262058 [Tribonema minus]